MPGGIHAPIEVLATWKYDYDPAHYKTGGFYVVVVVAVLLALSYIAVGLRLWSRLVIAKNYGIDDALIVFNMIPLTGTAVGVILAMTRYGFDRHVWNIPIPVLKDARKITLGTEMMYMVSTCTTKISILLFYRRLVTGTLSTTFLYCVYAAIASVVIYFGIFFFALAGICNPLSTYWKMADWVWYETNKDSIHCLPEGPMLIASAVISAVQDFLACGLPAILLWKLRMPRKQKIALAVVFAVGFFLCVCAVIRTVYIYHTYYNTYDMTWISQPAWLWLAIEAEMAIVCASAPALKVFVKKALAATIKSHSNSYNDKSQSTGRSAPRNTGTRKVDQWNASDNTEETENFNDEYEFVMYDKYGQKVERDAKTLSYSINHDKHGKKLDPELRGATFYDELESVDREGGHTFFEEADVTDGNFYVSPLGVRNDYKTPPADSGYYHHAL